MTILHVTDFHFNKRWFDWLLHRAPAHDLVLVLSSHEHNRRHWRDRRNEILFLNPGRSAEGAVPNHILVRTDPMSCQFFSAPGEDIHDSEFLVPSTSAAGNAIATIAVA